MKIEHVKVHEMQVKQGLDEFIAFSVLRKISMTKGPTLRN